MYTGPKQILKVIKNTDIPLSREEVLNYHCEYYIMLKSTCIISYTLLSPAIRPFVEIYIDIAQYKPISFNKYKYTVYILNYYFNYQ